MSASSYREDVQGLRAVAVLLVMAYHADLPVPGGFAGVDVFFVVSGFVITRLLRREHIERGRVDLRAFYLRRVQRILPALTFLLCAVVSASALLQSPLGPQQVTAHTARAAATFWANLQLYGSTGGYFDGPAERNPLLHMWSLSVEEQFYFVIPSLLALASARGWSWTVPLLVVAIPSSIAAVVGTFHPFPEGATPALAFYGAHARAWQFVVGALVALLPADLTGHPVARPGPLYAVLAAVLVPVAAFVLDDQTPFPGVAAWLPTVGTAAALVAGSLPDRVSRAVRATLGARWLTRIGDLSYSLYLWHWPAAVFGRLLFPEVHVAPLVGVVLSALPAWASYRWIETPVRHARLNLPRGAALGLGCVLLPFSLGLALQAGADRAWGDDVTLTAHRVRTAPKGIGCEWNAKRGGGRPEVCERPAPGALADPARSWLLLTGDSHATAVSAVFVEVAHELGYHAAFVSTVGCPFADLPLVDDDGPRDHCRVFVEHTLGWIDEHDVALVTVANRSPVNANPTVWLHDETTAGRLPKCAGATYGKDGRDCLPEAEAVELWDRGLRAVAARILPRAPLLIVGTVPEHTNDVMDCVEPRHVDAACARTPRETVEARRRPALDRERALDSEEPRVAFLDTLSSFCDAEACLQWAPGGEAGTFLYRDDDHLSAEGAARLRDPLRAAIRGAITGDTVAGP